MGLHFTIRPLAVSDLCAESGFYQTLENLSPAPVVNTEWATKILHKNVSLGKNVWVAVDNASGQIIGTTSFFVEYKFSRGGVVAGHIEDMVTREGFESNHVASALMKTAIQSAKSQGC